jgi:hypothetical protein
MIWISAVGKNEFESWKKVFPNDAMGPVSEAAGILICRIKSARGAAGAVPRMIVIDSRPCLSAWKIISVHQKFIPL